MLQRLAVKMRIMTSVNLFFFAAALQPCFSGALWLTDLLQPDPYYVLPVTVGFFSLLNYYVSFLYSFKMQNAFFWCWYYCNMPPCSGLCLISNVNESSQKLHWLTVFFLQCLRRVYAFQSGLMSYGLHAAYTLLVIIGVYFMSGLPAVSLSLLSAAHCSKFFFSFIRPVAQKKYHCCYHRRRFIPHPYMELVMLFVSAEICCSASLYSGRQFRSVVFSSFLPLDIQK